MSQFLDRVKFGNGKDGAPPSSLDTNNGMGWGTFTGTATQTSGSYTDVYAGWRIVKGDVVLIHQSQGTGAGQWEINVATVGFGSLPAHSVTFAYPLAYTYGAGCQIIRVPQYTGGTMSSALTPVISWNGGYGGIIALMCNGDLTISGSLSIVGTAGTAGNSNGGGATGGGFRGGDRRFGNPATGYSGDGTIGNSASQNGARGNGGGGGYNAAGFAGGGGGGNGAAGSAGGGSTYGGTGGAAGGAAGAAALTTMVFGGGGGGATRDNTDKTGGSGASGGGIILIMAKNITITGSISINGASGGSGSANFGSGGGGSAGGSCLIKCQNAALGTNKITATAGAGGTGGYGASGGAGGVGRIRCDYYTSVTGTTSPALSSAEDPSLNVPGNTGAFFQFL